MSRLIAIGTLVLCLAAVACCTIGINRVFVPIKADQDANIILQGMKSVPLRQGDKPVDIQAE